MDKFLTSRDGTGRRPAAQSGRDRRKRGGGAGRASGYAATSNAADAEQLSRGRTAPPGRAGGTDRRGGRAPPAAGRASGDAAASNAADAWEEDGASLHGAAATKRGNEGPVHGTGTPTSSRGAASCGGAVSNATAKTGRRGGCAPPTTDRASGGAAASNATGKAGRRVGCPPPAIGRASERDVRGDGWGRARQQDGAVVGGVPRWDDGTEVRGTVRGGTRQETSVERAGRREAGAQIRGGAQRESSAERRGHQEEGAHGAEVGGTVLGGTRREISVERAGRREEGAVRGGTRQESSAERGGRQEAGAQIRGSARRESGAEGRGRC